MRVAAALGYLVLLAVPMIATCLAWDARGTRPEIVRKCARMGMLSSIVATVALVGLPVLLEDTAHRRIRFLLEAGVYISLLQAAAFSLSWVALNAPRRRRDEGRSSK